jgi:hypothetical protein
VRVAPSLRALHSQQRTSSILGNRYRKRNPNLESRKTAPRKKAEIERLFEQRPVSLGRALFRYRSTAPLQLRTSWRNCP